MVVFRYSSRFWLYAPTLFFLALAVIVMAYWKITAGAFEKKLAALKGHDAVPGIAINWDSAVVGGFPFRIEASFTNLRIQGAGAHGPFSWRTEKFALHALTYGRSKMVYEAAGRQQAQWTQSDGQSRAVSFLPGSMHGSSIVKDSGLQRFDLDIVDMGAAAFTVRRFQFHMRRDPDGRDLNLMLKADALQAKGAAAKNLQVYASLNRADLWMSLLRGESAWPQAAATWRTQGGKATLTKADTQDESPDALLSPFY